MKQFKLFLWIAGLMFLETVISVFCNINGIVPDFMLAFAMAYSAYERSLKSVMTVAVICGVIACAMSAGPFVVMMMTFAVGAALVYMAYDAPHRMAGAMRAAVGTALFTAARGAIFNISMPFSFDSGAMLYATLPLVFINAGFAALIYAALTKCFHIKDTAKKLIIS